MAVLDLTQTQIDALRALDARLTQPWTATGDPYSYPIVVLGSRGVLDISPSAKYGFDMGGPGGWNLANDLVALRNALAQILGAIT